jgi:hypothetical protein
VLTALAGIVDSERPAGPWDARAGFRTEGEAARSRRLEDERACTIVGAVPQWLDFADHQYEQRQSEDELRSAIVKAVDGRTVLLPGFPLRHDDHAWIAGLLADAFPAERVGVYVEQPYGAHHTDRPGVSDEPSTASAPGPAAWRPLRAGIRDRLRKLAACRAYRSQVPLFDSAVLRHIVKYELRVGGEAIVPPAS